jgi:hypothetical protein
MPELNNKCAPPCEALIRMQEETKSMNEKIDLVLSKLDNLDKVYVRKDMFDEKLKPLQKLVYGGAGVILTGTLLAILALVLEKK